ncbi:MAG: hypothetical protein V4719_01015 [Planctomycetota bacterium]
MPLWLAKDLCLFEGTNPPDFEGDDSVTNCEEDSNYLGSVRREDAAGIRFGELRCLQVELVVIPAKKAQPASHEMQELVDATGTASD